MDMLLVFRKKDLWQQR